MKLNQRFFGKRWLSALTLIAFVFLILAPAGALPEQPSVVHGQIQIQNLGQLQQILQSSPQGIINWNAFSIKPDEIVRILQPNGTSVLLNRVVGSDPSKIMGLLQANGRVFLVNPNGILFGPNSRVDAGSFLATTLAISDQDFLKGNYVFAQNPQAKLAAIVNQGEIRVADGGFVVLAAPLLHNDGLIVARQGTVNLAASEQATLQLDPQGLWEVVVPKGFTPSFQNPQSPGQAVLLQRDQVTDVLSSVINSGGVLEASSLEQGANGLVAHNSNGLALNSGQILVDGAAGHAAGRIRIDSERASLLSPTGRLSAVGTNADAGDIRLLSNGATLSAGQVDVHSTGSGKAGFVELSGRQLSFGPGINLQAENGQHGFLLLDPVDLTIVSGAAGDWDATFAGTQTVPAAGSIGADTISDLAINSITTGTVSLQATRDILFAGPAPNLNLPNAVTLDMNAGRDIRVTSTTSTGAITITAGNINLTAGRDLILQGRNGVNVTATNVNGGANLTAGRNLTVQYNNILGGTFNPVQVMALTSQGSISLTAGNDLTFATNNLGDTINGNPNKTAINASGAVLVNAGRNADIGVALQSGATANVVAANNLTINPLNISVASSSPVAGNLFLSGANVAVNTNLRATNSLNVTATNGDFRLISASPNVTAGNFTANVTGDILWQSNVPDGRIFTTSNSLSLQANRDITIQGRDGVDMVSNGSANLNAGRNLTVQYNNILPGSFNPRQVMALTAQGPINLTAGNDVTFATNNLGDVINGNPNKTAINSSGAVLVNAGRNVYLSSAVQSGTTANVVAANNLTINPLNITVASSSPVAGNLILSGANVAVNTNLSATNSLNVTASNGDFRLISASPNVTASNFTANVTGDILWQSNVPDGRIFTTSNSLSLQANRDITIQGRDGVDMVSNGSANLNAGRNLTVQYNNILPGSFNPRQVMALTAQGPINLTAGNDVTFATNNLGDAINGNPNKTAINSSGAVLVNAGRNVYLSSAVQSGTTANVVAANNLTINPLNITVASSSPVAGNLILSGANVAVNTNLRASNSLNVTATNGDFRLISASPNVTAGNFTANATGDILWQSNVPDGRIFTTSNSLNLQANRDITIQGRNGVDMVSNGSANLNAGRNLTVQYNNILPGSFNPRQVMALTAQGSINLVAGNDFIFATNNLGDPINGNPSKTAINATGPINIGAGNNAFLGVSARTPATLNVTANSSLTIQPQNISVTEASPSSGNLLLTANSVAINTNLTATNVLNVTANTGNFTMLSASPNITASNFTATAAQDILWQSNVPTGRIFTSANVLALQAGRDLTIQGRDGVDLVSNSSANLNAGRNLTVQYNNILPGSFNPRRVLALTAPGPINLTAGNGLTFSTNNLGDVIDGSPSKTAINSSSDIRVTAGQNLTLGVALQTPANAVVLATNSLVINPQNISVPEVSPVVGSLQLSGSDVAVNTNVNVTNLLNVTTTAGNFSMVSAAPNITAGNFVSNVAQDILLQSSSPTGAISTATNNLNLQANRDITIQGRNGVSMVSNGSATLAAGRNLTLQYRNILNGTFNPRRVMTVTAQGPINLTAGNDLTFATNNLGDTIDGAPSRTAINSSAAIDITAGNSAYLGVALRTPATANVTAASNLTINPQNISVAEASPNAGNLFLSGANLVVNTDVTTTGLFQATALAGNYSTVHAAPNISAGNLVINASSGVFLQSTAPTGSLTVTSNGTSITAGNDILIQGRNGVNVTTDGLVNVTAGRDLTVQYANLAPGSFNPRQLMSVNASGNINLQAGRDFTFATNNNGDVVSGSPLATRLQSTGGDVLVNASNNSFVGVATNSVRQDTLMAGNLLSIGNQNISGASASTNTQGNLTLAANALNISTGVTMTAQEILTLNLTGPLVVTGDLNSNRGLVLISGTNLVSNGHNLTAPNGPLNLVVTGNGQMNVTGSNLAGNSVAVRNLGNSTANVTGSNINSSSNILLDSSGNGTLNINSTSLNASPTGNLTVTASNSGSLRLTNDTATGNSLVIINSGNGTMDFANNTFTVNSALIRDAANGAINFQGNLSASQGMTVENLANGTTTLSNGTLVGNSRIDMSNLASGNLVLSNTTLNATNINLNNNSSGNTALRDSRLDSNGQVNLLGSGPLTFSNSSLNATGPVNLSGTIGLNTSNVSGSTVQLDNAGNGTGNISNSNIAATSDIVLSSSSAGNLQINSSNITGPNLRLATSNNGSLQLSDAQLTPNNLILAAGGTGLLAVNNSSVNSSNVNITNLGPGGLDFQGNIRSTSSINLNNQANGRMIFRDGTLNATTDLNLVNDRGGDLRFSNSTLLGANIGLSNTSTGSANFSNSLVNSSSNIALLGSGPLVLSNTTVQAPNNVNLAGGVNLTSSNVQAGQVNVGGNGTITSSNLTAAGSLLLNSNGSLTANSTNLVGNSVTLQNVGLTSSNLTSNSTFTLTNGNLTGGRFNGSNVTVSNSNLASSSINATGTATVQGQFSLNSTSLQGTQVVVNGSGNATGSNVAGNNVSLISEGGPLQFTGGTINATGSGNIQVNNGSTLEFSQSQFTSNGLNVTSSGTGNLLVNGSTLNSTNSNFVNQGSGQLRLTSSNVLSGSSGNFSNLASGNLQLDSSTVNVSGNSTFVVNSGQLQIQNSKIQNGQDLFFTTNGGQLSLDNSNQAGRNVIVNISSGNLVLSGANTTASNSLLILSNSSAPLQVSSSQLNAGQNLTVDSSSTLLFNNSQAQSSGDQILRSTSNLTVNNSSFNSTTGVNVGTNSTLQVSDGSRIQGGSLKINAGQSVLLAPNSLVNGTTVTVQGGREVNIGRLSGQNVTVNATAGNILLASMSQLNGGDFRFYTPLALLEQTPVSPTATLIPLGSISFDVGNIFGNATLTSPFSVVNASTIDILITAPNDPGRGKAADLRQFAGAKATVRRGPNAGDIFLDGVQLFVDPVVPPAPVPAVPSAPTPQEIPSRAVLDDSRQVEIINQLAQANLALGNKSGTAYFISMEAETPGKNSDNAFWYSDDRVSGPFFDLPFSVTLEHVLLLDPRFARDRDKTKEEIESASLTTVQSQEQDAWELQYWRRFIERIILWVESEE